MKRIKQNIIEKYIKLNKKNYRESNNAQGITLIALIVTIVVLIVVAGISINATVGENGIFTKAIKAKEMQEAAEIKERLELKQLDARLALGGENMTLENYLKYLVDQGMIDESDIEDTADSNIKTILVDNKYIYTVAKKDDGSIGLEYEGKAGKLLPKIKSVNTKSTTSSIEVKVDATRVDGGEYRFYIKDVTSGEEYKKKETNKTGEYIFTGLEQNREFKIKIEVENKNGIAESETNVIRTVTVAELTQADLEFTYNPNDWTKDKIVVTVNEKIEIPEGYTLQTSKDMINWENTTTQEFTENGYMYVRLYDGTNGGNYAVGEVTKIDKDAPIVTTTSATSNSITFSGTDNASGIIGYTVTTIKVEPTNFIAVDNTKALNNITIGERLQKTEYYVWLKDKAENVSEPVTIKTDEATGVTQADINFTYSPSEWTNGKVTVTASLKTTIPTGYTLQTSKDATNWESKATQEFTANGYIYVRLYDGTNGGTYAVGEVSKIDIEKPKITNASATATAISFTATDNASGIIGYKVTTDNNTPTSFDSCTSTLKLEKTLTGLKQNTTYNIWVKDEAGNISEKQSKTTTTIAVTGVSLDKTTASLIVGNTTTAKATITPSDAYNKNIKWSSSNASVATVSTEQTTSGTAITITAKAPGTANIVATTVDGNKTATCNVTVSYPTLVSQVAVGDYVAYQPGTHAYTSSANGHGNQTYTSNNNLKWRVLSKNTSTGEVILISEAPISPDSASLFYFKGAKAYLYNMEQLDRICAIYGYGTGADTSKSFTGYNGDEYSGKQNYTISGTGARSIKLTEIDSYVGYTPTNGETFSRNVQAPSLSASNNIATATTRTYRHTYYGYTASTYLNSSTMIYKLLFRNTADNANINYWISGKNMEVYSNRTFITFCISHVENGGISANYVGLGDSSYCNQYEYSKTGVRPVIYLKKTLKTSGKNSSGQWIIIDN